jgi:hypothetical protein
VNASSFPSRRELSCGFVNGSRLAGREPVEFLGRVLDVAPAAAHRAALRGLFLATVVFVWFFAVPVQAKDPTVTALSPSGAQAGSEVSVTFSGARLHDAQEILFYAPGIEAVKLESVETNAVKALLKMAPDCRFGEHHLRLRTASGVSEVRTFFVGPYPTVDEVEPNNSPEQAQPVPMNSTVSGVVAAEDRDFFAVEVKQGERLSVEVEGMRLGRTFFDPYVAIRSSDGKVLALSDDTALLLQDCFVSIIAPRDGTYIVEVRETTFGGSATSFYRAHIGNFPRPKAVYPGGGKAGETIQVQLIGDPSGPFEQEIVLPETPSEKFPLIARHNGQIAPSPNWLRASSFPNVLESEPNNERTQATAASIEPPLAFNGIIGEKGDIDWFQFKAGKGQVFDVHVYARRIRSPLDSILQIFNGAGNRLAENVDSAGSDSYLRFTAPDDGNYFLTVTDHLGRGGPDYVYRIELSKVEPSLHLSIPPVARNDTQSRQAMVVPRGNRFATLISARRNEFSGDVGIQIENLPPGVTLHAGAMHSSQNTFPVVFEAAPDAALGGTLLGVSGFRVEGDERKPLPGGFRHVLELVYGNPNNTVYYQTEVDQLAVAVAEEAPFTIRIIEPQVPLVQNGYLDLKIVAERQEGFDEPINVRMLFNPPGVGSLPDMTIPKESPEVLYRLNAAENAAVHDWKIAVIGTATVEGGAVWVSSQLANLRVAEPFLTMKIETAAAEQGHEVSVVAKIEHKRPFEGKAKVTLLGLPHKVTAPELEITKDDAEVVFPVSVDAESPAGQHKALFCNVVIMQNSEPVAHNAGAGGILRIDPPRKKAPEPAPVAAAAPPKPEKRLTRLEMLRLEQAEREKNQK